ncbi:MAG: hypothetical protein KTR15_13455 [Phycisphaeraceae bacterium]|nr:hypothetical protein [Phycisphaeraceae bacterium]
MELTKQRKVLVGVLCLGLGGLVVDRFVLGSPETASAGDEVITVEAPPAAEPLAGQAPEPDVTSEPVQALPSYSSLTRRLIQAQEQAGPAAHTDQNDDPFALPKQWQVELANPLNQPASDPATQTHRISGLFKLDGTVRTSIDGKDEMLAVISGGGLDGRAIRVGQKVRVPDGKGSHKIYKLIRVGSRFVVWQPEGTQEEITMRVEEVL